jgi:signal transduction histidine kinase
VVSALLFHWLFFSDPQEAEIRRAMFRAIMASQGIAPSPWRHLLLSPFTGTVLTALVVSAVTLPIMRRLTRRLEHLQQGVRALGEGDLSARVAVQGRDEVAQLAQSFNTAAARIESLMQSHKSLLAYTSHELRTPLTRLRLSLETLASPVPAAARDIAVRAAKHDLTELDALIDDILLASRLDAAPGQSLQLEDIDLLALVAEEAAHFDVDVHGDWITLRGDERLLRRAVRNLLDNARRHAPGTNPQVSLTAIDGGGIVRVCDQGPGVPAADAQRIFEPFVRLSGHSDGTGLGLPLVRRIARQHGGEARCLPQRSGGTCFEIWLGRKP